jgi:hypothetical protein
MSKKMLLAMCLGAGVLWLPTAASGVVWNTATSPPDTAASVNGTPNGVWSTSALAKASSSQVVSAAADSNGCPSQYGCGWKDSYFVAPMGKWAGPNSKFSVFGQQACQEGNWNDCISSTDNNGVSGCRINWYYDINYGQPLVYDAQYHSRATLGGANDKFSSDNWCG